MFGVLVSEQGCWMKLNIGQDTASFALINPLNPDFNIYADSHLLSLYVCYRSSGENSLKYQLDLSGMIMSSILVTVISQDKAPKHHTPNGQCPGTLCISTA